VSVLVAINTANERPWICQGFIHTETTFAPVALANFFRLREHTHQIHIWRFDWRKRLKCLFANAIFRFEPATKQKQIEAYFILQCYFDCSS